MFKIIVFLSLRIRIKINSDPENGVKIVDPAEEHSHIWVQDPGVLLQRAATRQRSHPVQAGHHRHRFPGPFFSLCSFS